MKNQKNPVLMAYLLCLHQLKIKGLSIKDRSTLIIEAATMAERLTDAEIEAARLAADLMADFIAVQKKLAN